MRGMASSGGAERLLGVTHLRRVRAVVRPDEYGKRRLGRAHEPRGGQLWVPWDRTTGVIGPQVSAYYLICRSPYDI
jgi:hypothetical protein